jgi:hypothetical protein
MIMPLLSLSVSVCGQLKGEEAVRRGGLESYVIVRAAGLRESNDGVKKLVEIGQVRRHP